MTLHKLSDKDSGINIFIESLVGQFSDPNLSVEDIILQIEEYKRNHLEDSIVFKLGSKKSEISETELNMVSFLDTILSELRELKNNQNQIMYQFRAGVEGKSATVGIKYSFDTFMQKLANGPIPNDDQFGSFKKFFSLMKTSLDKEANDQVIISSSLECYNNIGKKLSLESEKIKELNEALSSAEANGLDEAEIKKIEGSIAKYKKRDIERQSMIASSFENMFIEKYKFVLNTFGADSVEAYLYLQSYQVSIVGYMNSLGTGMDAIPEYFSGLPSDDSDKKNNYLQRMLNEIQAPLDLLSKKYEKTLSEMKEDSKAKLDDIESWQKFDRDLDTLSFAEFKNKTNKIIDEFLSNRQVDSVEKMDALRSIKNAMSSTNSKNTEKDDRKNIRGNLKVLLGVKGKNENEIEKMRVHLSALDENALGRKTSSQRKPTAGNSLAGPSNIIQPRNTDPVPIKFEFNSDDVSSFLGVMKRHFEVPGNRDPKYKEGDGNDYFKYLRSFKSVPVDPSKVDGDRSVKLKNFFFKMIYKLMDNQVRFSPSSGHIQADDANLTLAAHQIQAYLMEDKESGFFSKKVMQNRGLSYLVQIAEEYKNKDTNEINIEAMCDDLMGKKELYGATEEYYKKDRAELTSFLHKLLNKEQSLTLHPAKLNKTSSGPSSQG